MNNTNLKKWPIAGHKKVLGILKNIIINQKLPHALLFSGPSNIGKTFVAKNFIKTVLCSADLRPCDKCASCKNFENNAQSDVMILEDSNSLKIKNIRRLKHDLSLGRAGSKYKICLLCNAERLTTEAANALLKILEEPTDKTLLILTTENHEHVLPTIVSRCVLVNFLEPSSDEIEKYFSTYYKNESIDLIKKLILNSAKKPGVIHDLLENKDKIKKIENIHMDFEIMLKKDSFCKKFDYANKLAKKEKSELKEILSIWRLYLRNMMLCKLNILSDTDFFQKDVLKKHSLLEINKNILKIDKTIFLLTKNINKKLLIDSLIINL